MKKPWKRLVSLALTGTLISGLFIQASAFTFPSAYWPLQASWAQAVENQDIEQTISVVQQTYDLFQGQPLCKEICEILEPYSSRAAWCYELKGDLDNAILWRQRQLTYAQWLNDNVRSYQDTILNVNAQLNHLQAGMELYALVSDPDVPYYGSIGEPTSGIYYGTTPVGTHIDDSAALIYVNFADGYTMEYWLDYYAALDPVTDKALNGGGVVEVAWNFTENNAGLQTVLSSDSYISESLAHLGSRNSTVLLRIGAEMNCWTELPDPATYIQAYQKIAREARQYSNIALVFSPNDVNNRTVDYETYYPGDAYVDWIGVSTYKRNDTGYGSVHSYANTGYSNDAFYCCGIYGHDPLIVLADLAEMAQRHQKPMMISECGMAHYNNFSGTRQVEYAMEQMNLFYSYLPMVLPQVKAVFYFDNNMEGETYQYAMTNNGNLADTYAGLVSGPAYLQAGETSAMGYVPLDQVDQSMNTLNLATYASFPGVGTTTCQYYVDGALTHTSTQAPFSYALDTSSLSLGSHTIRATATRGNFSRTVEYTIFSDGQGHISQSGTLPVDLSTADPWANSLILSAYTNGLLTDRTDGNFRSNITRLQFAELAVNLVEKATGSTLSTGDGLFVDTQDPVALKAVAAGITSGKGEGRFAPDDFITRQEISVMLNQVVNCVDKATGTVTYTNLDTALSSRFTDATQVDRWAVSSMALLTNNGLMSGNGTTLNPKSNTTIQEAIALILALYNHF